MAEVGEEEDDREEDDEKIERQESKSDDDEDIDDIGIEQDDFDYEETVERVKEHFLRQVEPCRCSHLLYYSICASRSNLTTHLY